MLTRIECFKYFSAHRFTHVSSCLSRVFLRKLSTQWQKHLSTNELYIFKLAKNQERTNEHADNNKSAKLVKNVSPPRHHHHRCILHILCFPMINNTKCNDLLTLVSDIFTCRALGGGRSWWTSCACPPRATLRNRRPPWLQLPGFERSSNFRCERNNFECRREREMESLGGKHQTPGNPN